jgi:hypothetical protein
LRFWRGHGMIRAHAFRVSREHCDHHYHHHRQARQVVMKRHTQD